MVFGGINKEKYDTREGNQTKVRLFLKNSGMVLTNGNGGTLLPPLKITSIK